MTIIETDAAHTLRSRSPLVLGLLARWRTFWLHFARIAFDPYRPELHYMRGPGPAWRAKHGGERRS